MGEEVNTNLPENKVTDIKDLYGTLPFEYPKVPDDNSMVPNRKKDRERFEEDFLLMSEYFFKGLPLKTVSELSGINYLRVCKILRSKGIKYDTNVGHSLITTKGSVLTIIKVNRSGSKRTPTEYLVHCSECSKDKEIYPPTTIKSTMERLSSGKTPCGCSRLGSFYSKEQKEILIKRKLKGFKKDGIIKVLSVVKDSMTISCSGCGLTGFDVKISRFLRKGVINCKCNAHYKYKTKDERILDFNKDLVTAGMSNYKAVDYNETTKKFICTCSSCSYDQELWGYGKINLTKNNVKNRTYQCGCNTAGTLQWTKDQYITLLNRRCKEDGFIFNGFIGEYLKGETLISTTCENGHDNRCTLATTFLNKYQNRCNGCRVYWARYLYGSDPREIENRLLLSMLPQHTYLGFVGGAFKNQNQRFKYYCEEKDQVFERSIRGFLDGSKGSCCKGGGFKSELEGYFYLVRWSREGLPPFYKYGVTNFKPNKRISKQKSHTSYLPHYVGGFKFDTGSDAILLENSVKVTFKDQSVDRSKLPDGFTETVCTNVNKFATKELGDCIKSFTGYNVFNGEMSEVITPLPFISNYTYLGYVLGEDNGF